jgi:two-component system, LytTR family, sensor kinase
MHLVVGLVLGLAISVSFSAARRLRRRPDEPSPTLDPAVLNGARLQALRARISSHFVHNALAAVASDIRSDPEEARELLAELAEFTRYAVHDDRAYVTLAEELEYVARYLHLEQRRFGERLEVRLEVDPAALGTLLPTLSLQPLVENAVRHGVEASLGTGHVQLVVRSTGADVELRVHDDGPSIDPERARAALEGEAEGEGLANVEARLRTAFGEEYGIRFVSDGDGTTAVMRVPRGAAA